MSEETQGNISGCAIAEAIDRAGARGDLAAAIEHLTTALEFMLEAERRANAMPAPDPEANAAAILRMRRITSHLTEAFADVPPAFWAMVFKRARLARFEKVLASVRLN